jgi:hypothetical protein
MFSLFILFALYTLVAVQDVERQVAATTAETEVAVLAPLFAEEWTVEIVAIGDVLPVLFVEEERLLLLILVDVDPEVDPEVDLEDHTAVTAVVVVGPAADHLIVADRPVVIVGVPAAVAAEAVTREGNVLALCLAARLALATDAKEQGALHNYFNIWTKLYSQ